jgi:hypothetical protein
MHCTGNILRNRLIFLITGLFVLAVPFSQASDASRISGSYEVVGKTDIGSQTRVRLQLRLTNHEPRELRVQRLTVWDFSHPHKGGTQPCTIVLGAGASVGTTQEFTIPRAEFEMWTRGTRPRLVVEVQSSRGRITAEAVRLDREFKGKAE